MQTFYIFRHGLATHSTHGYGKDIFTASILEEGISAIKKIGTILVDATIDYAVRSEYLRCKQTTDIITSITGKDFTVDTRLNEFDNTNPLLHETFESVHERVSSFLDDMKKSQHKTIAVCTHGAVIGGFKHLLTNGTFTQEDTLDYPKTGILVVIRRTSIEEINCNTI